MTCGPICSVRPRIRDGQCNSVTGRRSGPCMVQDIRSAKPLAASALHAENDMNDALHFVELLWVQVVSDLDVLVFRPPDFESETCQCELNKSQAEVASVGIMIVGFDIANTTVIVLNLPLNDEIWVIGRRQIKVIISRELGIKRNLKVLPADGISRGIVLSTVPASTGANPRDYERSVAGAASVRIAWNGRLCGHTKCVA
jgi:hypothetical protein